MSEVAWQGAVAASTGYQYDGLGRFETVIAQGLSHTYDYVPDTNLLHTVTSRVGTQERLVGTRTYDDLGRLDTIGWTASVNGPVISAHDYELDDLGRRVRAEREDGTHWSYGHNERGEVTSGSRQTAQNQPLPGWSFGYNYDAIGNRSTATEARTTSGQIQRTYAPNALNQYTTISVNPRLLNVRGRASMSATVTVNTGTEADPNFLNVQRSGGIFAAEAVVNNANTPDFIRVLIEASQEGAGKDGQTLRTKRSGGIYVPPATSQLTYDLDGNLTDDPRWHYTWDGENRLISMETQATAAAAGVPRQRLEFAYDSRNRRIAKRMLHARSDGILPSSIAWTLDHETRFLWDGWRLMAEVESKSAAVPFAVLRSYTWGLDVSGSLEGAGCVGGLLAVNSLLPAMNAQSTTASSVAASGGQSTVTLLPTYDGNGNISALVSAATSETLARWDYDPFGNRLTDAEIAWQELCPFGFSTKYEDTESGLLYYGYRYYSAEMGRWVNRDPIGERGGVNLYGMVSNKPSCFVDVLGRTPQTQQQFANKFKCYCLVEEIQAVKKGIEDLNNVLQTGGFKNITQFHQRLNEEGSAGVGEKGVGVVGAGASLSPCLKDFVSDIEHWKSFNSNPKNTSHPNALSLNAEQYAQMWGEAELQRMENLLEELRAIGRLIVAPKFCCSKSYNGKY